MQKGHQKTEIDTSEIRSLRARVVTLERELEAANRACSHHRELEERYRCVLEVAVDGIVVIDSSGLIESFNPAAAKIFGFSQDEVLGKNVSLLMNEPQRSQHDGYLQHYLRGGVGKIIGSGREVIGRRRDGSSFPMELAVAEFRLGDRRLFTGITRDISQRRHAEEEASAAQQRLLELKETEAERVSSELQKTLDQLTSQAGLTTLGQVAATIAHELRSPLAGAHNAASLLRGCGPEDNPEFSRYVDWVDHGIFAADRIIGNLLETTRSTAALPQPTDLAELILRLWQRLSPAAAIALDVVLTPEPFLVYADPLHLSQLMNNLITNAVDAMGDAGELRIVGRLHGDGECSIEVHDSGPGIDRAQRQKIFEPLFTTKPRGVGLGLSVCRDLVTLNHGSLELMESDTGARFRIGLPYADASLAG